MAGFLALAVAGCGAAEELDEPAFGNPTQGSGVQESALTDPTACEGTFVWSEFIATAAEVTPAPSLYKPEDTRAGSVEVNFNGGFGFNGSTNDAPFAAGIVTLRNGASSILEQIQMNRRWGTDGLDSAGCRDFNGHRQCWIWSPANLVAGLLTAFVPNQVATSNEDFDYSGQRVQMAGGATIDFSNGAPTSSADGTYRFNWEAPKGMATSRANLRVHFDGDKNGEMQDNPLVTLLRINWPGDGPDIMAPGLKIVSKSKTALEVTGNVADALTYTCDNEVDDECDLTPGPISVSGTKVTWTITNGGIEPTTLTALYVGWSATAGNLATVTIDGTTVMDQSMAPGSAFIDAWTGSEDNRTFAAGQERTVSLAFAKTAPTDPGRYELLAGFEDGCLIEPTPKTPPTCVIEQDPNVCVDGHKPFSITFRYTGESCDASSHEQGSSSACKGDPALAETVRVVAQSKNTLGDAKATVWVDQTLTLGDAFTLAATNASGKNFASNVDLFIVSESGELLQAVAVHTSCSVPLMVGDQFGAFRIEGYASKYATPTTSCPGGTGPDACEDGKMASLEMRYTGGGCDKSAHSQAAKKSWCEGYPNGASPVRILAVSKADPEANGKTKVWFDGIVEKDGAVSIAGPNAGQGELGGNAYVYVMDMEGNQLQKLAIHTSCSQPLNIGDVFGSLVLEGFTH